MQRRIPKNIRQIGSVNDEDKLYVEDYVATYLDQLAGDAPGCAAGAFLAGERTEEGGTRYIYVYGAACIDGITMEDGRPKGSEDAGKKAEELCKTYFPKGEILGLFLAAEGCASGADAGALRFHEKYLKKEMSFLLLRDVESEDTHLYLYRNGELTRLGGYCVYYEKNPAMQNYLIDRRKGVGIESPDVVPDTAAQSFRRILLKKEEEKKKRLGEGALHRMSYALSTALVLAVLAMGVGAFKDGGGISGLRGALGASSGNVSVSGEESTVDPESWQDDDAQTSGTSGTADGQALDGASSGDSADTADGAAASDDTAAQEEQTDGGQASDGPSGSVASGIPEGSASLTGDGSDAADDDAQTSSGASEEEDAEQEDGAAKTTYYTVQKGDTLAGISRKMYGTSAKIQDICEANGISNVDLIIEGQKIVLP